VTEQGIRERIDALAPWFHTIDLGSGVQIQRDMVHGGDNDYPQHLWTRVRRMFPAGLAGMRVLDVGCNAGFFSAEMKRLGVSYVLGIEAVPRYLEQAKLVRNALHLDIDLRQLSVYEVSEKLGTFDVTLFLGVSVVYMNALRRRPPRPRTAAT
jgi:tRNA (mo5U34)-methyltransferase